MALFFCFLSFGNMNGRIWYFILQTIANYIVKILQTFLILGIDCARIFFGNQLLF